MSGCKIIRVWVYGYFSSLQQLYRRHPELIEWPYEDHRNFILDHHYGYGAGFSRAMRGLGYEADELIAGIFRLQTAWVRDHGLPSAVTVDRDDVLVDQISRLKPDVLYVQGVSAFTPHLWRRVREACPSLRLVIGYLGYTLDPRQIDGVDFLFLNMASIDGAGQLGGMPTDVLYHAFDPAAAQQAPAQGPQHDFAFCGTTGHYDAQYADRYRMLVELGCRVGLKCWSEEGAGDSSAAELQAAAAVREILATHAPDEAAIRALAWLDARQVWPSFSRLLPDRAAGPVFGTDMHRLIADSKISFNRHVKVAGGQVGNMRMFEVTGNGSCLMTEDGTNLGELFEPDSEVVTYRSVDECVEKVRYLLDHEDERRRIAEAGRRRTLSSHSWDQRCLQIDAVVRRMLGSG